MKGNERGVNPPGYRPSFLTASPATFDKRSGASESDLGAIEPVSESDVVSWPPGIPSSFFMSAKQTHQ